MSSSSRRVLVLVVLGTIVRLALDLLIGPSVDESYAAVMSRHLSLSYYDHPPLLFWIPGLAARLAGTEAAIAIRLPFVAMFAVTTWLLYRLGALLFGERAGVFTAVALNLVLFFTWSAASWVLPDGPLLLFSAAAALSLAHATLASNETGGETHWPGWLGFGLFSGLALLSKYHGAFLLLGAAAFLLSSPPHRIWLRRPQPYAAALLAALTFSPVIVWNLTHDWASIRFQSGRAVPIEDSDSLPLLDSIAGQAGWILPWMWVPLLVVLVGALRRGREEPRRWLLVCLGIGPIAVFTLVTAFGSRGLPHWQAPGYFILLPLLGAAVAERLERGDRAVRWWLASACLGLLLALGLVVAQTQWALVDRVAPRLLVKGDPTDDLVSWTPVATQLREWGFPRPDVVVAGATWADAAKIGYALGPSIDVASVGPDPRGFEFVHPQASLVGRDVLLVARRRPGREAMAVYAPYFARIKALGTISLRRDGLEAVAVSVYLGQQLLRPIPPRRGR